MKHIRFVTLAGLVFLVFWTPARAVDHNNIDDGRPLGFDDARSISLRERTLELGLGLGFPQDQSAIVGSRVEFKYGFALNRDLSLSIEPSYLGESKEFDASNVEVAYFQSLQREIGNSPALAYRVAFGLPTGRDAKGVDGNLRGILTKAIRQYDRLHINVDGTVRSNSRESERTAYFGAVLGYTKPLGYPRVFTRTLVGEYAMRQSPVKGQGWTGSLGLGLRQQVTVRSVFDVGITSDIFAIDSAPRNRFGILAGVSYGF